MECRRSNIKFRCPASATHPTQYRQKILNSDSPPCSMKTPAHIAADLSTEQLIVILPTRRIQLCVVNEQDARVFNLTTLNLGLSDHLNIARFFQMRRLLWPIYPHAIPWHICWLDTDTREMEDLRTIRFLILRMAIPPIDGFGYKVR